MEFFIKLAFYDSKWFIFKQKPLSFYVFIFSFSFLINFFQIYMILSYSYTNTLDTFKVYFLYSSFIEIVCLLALLSMLYYIYNKRFNFLHIVKKINHCFQIKSYETIMRDQVSLSFIGISNIFFSIVKLCICLLDNSLSNFSESFNGEYTKNIAFGLFDVYYYCSYYMSIYLIFSGFMFLAIKGGFVFFSFFKVKVGFFIQRVVKNKSSLDNIKEKTINNFIHLIDKLTKQHKAEKKNDWKGIGKDNAYNHNIYSTTESKLEIEIQ